MKVSQTGSVSKVQIVQTVAVPVILFGRTIHTNFVVLLDPKDNRTLLGIGFLEDTGIVQDLP